LLNKDAVNELLLASDLALVPNKPDSLVACPYKAGEYAAAGLPMLSCLDGELNQLLSEWNAGSKYTEGDAASLQAAFERYLTNRELLNQHSQNAREMAETLFDRNQTYAALAEFMLDSSFRV
jgi:glycosyltransferase involved in cell wall biosynthesis